MHTYDRLDLSSHMYSVLLVFQIPKIEFAILLFEGRVTWVIDDVKFHTILKLASALILSCPFIINYLN